MYWFIFRCGGSSLLHGLFSSCGKLGLLSNWSVWASHCLGFPCCKTQTLGCMGSSSCGTWAQQLQHLGSSSCGTWAQQLLHLGSSSCGTWAPAVVAPGPSSCGTWALEHRIKPVAHRLSCSLERGLLLGSGDLKLCLLHWQVDSLPQSHQASPGDTILE